ncbi:MAG: rod shape-determining protein RodA [Alkalispirochaeta sp.]
MIKSRSIFEIDLYVVIATVSLLVVGVLFVFSSGVTADGQVVSNEYIRQIVWGVTGIVLMLLMTFVDYRVLYRPAVVIFGAILVILIFTVLFGQVVNGSRSWIGVGNLGGQPSEFAKIALIILLARYFGDAPDRGRTLIGFSGAVLITLIPTLLVLVQPDLGTAIVYLPIFLVIAYAAGADFRMIGFVLGLGAFTILFTVLPVWEEYLSERSFPLVQVLNDSDTMLSLLAGLSAAAGLSGIGYWFTRRPLFFWIVYGLVILILSVPMAFIARSVLQEYQLMRLIVFVDPYVDPRGAGWNIIQSVTAVGSGGPFGKGFLQGTQSHYQYLPEQSTDFIFSILAEEWGFLGVLAVFTLFGIILGRSLYIMVSAKDRFAALLVAGVVGMLVVHLVINVGMAVGVMPIMGIPLFLLSYGGSSLWTALIGIGIVMSVYQHRYQY